MPEEQQLQKTQYSLVINSEPGIQRDGTQCASTAYIDGKWLRFYNGLPRKMGGMYQIAAGASEFITNMLGYSPITTQVNAFQGRASSFTFATYRLNEIEAPEINISPVTTGLYPFVPNANNTWSITTFTQSIANDCGETGASGLPIPQANTTYVVACALPNAQNISSSVESQIFFGVDDGSGILYPLTDTDSDSACAQMPITTTGFVCAVGDYLFEGGAKGEISHCAPGDLTTWSTNNINIIGTSNLIQGLPTSSTSQPSILVWSLDTLWQGVLTPTEVNADNFVFTPRGKITILSPYTVIQVDSVYYWIGNRKFYTYTGVVQEIKNTKNKDYFFNNINYEYCGRIWSIYLPLYNEIVIFYPRGTSTVADSSIIYNIEENEFYDTPWARSAGFFVSGFQYPILADSQPHYTPTKIGILTNYPIWQHEIGTDMVIGTTSYAIESYYRSHYFCIKKESNEVDQQIATFRFEGDYVAENSSTLTTETMSIQTYCLAYPNSSPNISIPYTFDSTTPYVSFSSMGRYMSFKVSSNTNGGDYFAGIPTIKYTLGDSQPGS